MPLLLCIVLILGEVRPQIQLFWESSVNLIIILWGFGVNVFVLFSLLVSGDYQLRTNQKVRTILESSDPQFELIGPIFALSENICQVCSRFELLDFWLVTGLLTGQSRQKPSLEPFYWFFVYVLFFRKFD